MKAYMHKIELNTERRCVFLCSVGGDLGLPNLKVYRRRSRSTPTALQITHALMFTHLSCHPPPSFVDI